MSDTDFAESIKKWVSLDNQVKAYYDKVREIREQRNELSDTIMEYVDTSGLNNTTVKISDGKLRFTPTKQPSSLTLSYIEECLYKCLGDTDDVKKTMTYIKKNREIKVTRDIKRTYTNK